MDVEIRPLGSKCNLSCRYCYQQTERNAGNPANHYDLEAMKLAAKLHGGPITIFGGEPLIISQRELEDLLAWSFELYGGSTVQTNGTLITENHIRMFKQYNVRIGISIDGPRELNDARWAGSLKTTRLQTAKTESSLENLVDAGLSPSLIVTLHRKNALPDKLPIMNEWFHYLDKRGIPAVRLHVLEVEDEIVRDKLALSLHENYDALLNFFALEEKLNNLKFDVFQEMMDLLMLNDHTVSCVWHGCDPYTTDSVCGIEGHGQRSNCGRSNKDGINFVKTDMPSYERYIALYNTPQEFNGCQGCRFFILCKGQCPGTAINGDWRNRTEHCELWKKLFEYLERKLQANGCRPVSLDPNLIYLEQNILTAWEQGINPSIRSKLEEMLVAAESPVSSKSSKRTTGCAAIDEACQVSVSCSMQKYSSSVQNFNRQAWVNEQARKVWGDRIRRICNAWSQVEWMSVLAGIRHCSVCWVDADVHNALQNDLQATNLEIEPLEKNIDIKKQGWVIIGTREKISELKNSFLSADDVAAGELLGVPSCCGKFYKDVCLDHGLMDTTWQMAWNTINKSMSRPHQIELSGDISENNILLRWLGITPVFHLPCSFSCNHTKLIANNLTQLARCNNFEEEAEWLEEMINWPVEWSALHGIAEIKTPIVKISTCTDATNEKHTIRYHGSYYPEKGASGLSFPYQQPLISS